MRLVAICLVIPKRMRLIWHIYGDMAPRR